LTEPQVFGRGDLDSLSVVIVVYTTEEIVFRLGGRWGWSNQPTPSGFTYSVAGKAVHARPQ
jgi:hypothetical protein